MARKQLRTVKKSSQTGRLDRDAVRSEVIIVRDARAGQIRDRSSSGVVKARKKEGPHDRVSAGSTAGD
ncbi:MAG TPA: hypothetical protein VEX86_09505 [Longimicrobium sp.]|nr:hypothetical protein [Longimicrobium sp.]